MKFITVRDLRLKPGVVWKMAEKEKDIIITSNGRPVAILTGTNEENIEIELAALRKARAITALDMIHKESVNKKTDEISSRIINEEILQIRRRRKS